MVKVEKTAAEERDKEEGREQFGESGEKRRNRVEDVYNEVDKHA